MTTLVYLRRKKDDGTLEFPDNNLVAARMLSELLTCGLNTITYGASAELTREAIRACIKTACDAKAFPGAPLYPHLHAHVDPTAYEDEHVLNDQGKWEKKDGRASVRFDPSKLGNETCQFVIEVTP